MFVLYYLIYLKTNGYVGHLLKKKREGNKTKKLKSTRKPQNEKSKKFTVLKRKNQKSVNSEKKKIMMHFALNEKKIK